MESGVAGAGLSGHETDAAARWWERGRPRLAWVMLFCAGYLLGAGFAKWQAIIPGTGISVWPPAGLFLAALLLSPPSRWPWWLALGLLADLAGNWIWFGNPLWVALLLYVANAACATIGAALMHRLDRHCGRLESLSSVVVLLVGGALLAPVVAATIGAATLHGAEGQPFARAWALWWVGDATGVLLVAPLVLVGARAWQQWRQWSWPQLAEAALAGLLLATLAMVSLSGLVPFPFIVMPALLWIAVRFEFSGTALAMVLLALLAGHYTVGGLSPFAGRFDTARLGPLVMQLFLAVSAVTMLVVAAIARQHRVALGSLRGANDALERRVAERTAALGASEGRFRTLAAAVPVAVWVTDASGEIELVNPEYERFFGVRADDLRSGGWQPLVHPDDRAAYSQAFAAALQERREFVAGARVRRADGAWRYVESRGVPRIGAQGEFLGMIGISPDVTERHELETSLQEASRRKDEFLAMLGHELRNPLAPIRTAGELLRIAAPDNPAVQQVQAIIERQAAQLTRLVDDLLDMSRVASGKIVLQRAPVELAPVLRQAVETHQAEAQLRRQRLLLELPAEPLRVLGDPARLAQAVGNLIGNASKFSEAGGRIRVVLERTGSASAPRAAIRVHDEGRGLDPATLPRVFDMFFQADTTLDRAEGGLGLGLPLVHRLVEMHGGSVRAESEGLGHGSTFTIELPLLPPAPAAAPEPVRPAAAAPSAPRRILVVDDNRDSCDSIALLLRAGGHQVFTAYDGHAALATALRERPDVVLLDIGLPGLDGYAACRAMRDGGLADALIVAVTGYGQHHDRRASQAAGFDEHYVKPVSLEGLQVLLAKRR